MTLAILCLMSRGAFPHEQLLQANLASNRIVKKNNVVCASSDNIKKIELKEAGTLSQAISYSEKYSTTHLKISGPLNGTDLCLLREMAGCDKDLNFTEGKLKHLDLEDAIFVSGGSPYIKTYGKNRFTDDSTVFPESAFFKCTALAEIILPKYVTELARGSLQGYTYEPQKNNLTYVDLPVGLTKISATALSFNGNLRQLDIPSTVEIINDDFYKCESLFYICSYASVPPAMSSSFSSDTKIRTGSLKVPKGHSDKYWRAKGWEDFNNISEMDYDVFTVMLYPKTIGGKVGTGIVQTRKRFPEISYDGNCGSMFVKSSTGYTVFIYPDEGYKIEKVITDGEDKTKSVYEMGDNTYYCEVTDNARNRSDIEVYFTQNHEATSPKVLTFPDDNKGNNKLGSYTDTWTAKIGDDTWTISNFNNNKWNGWNYIRCGRKANESVASISTDFAIDKAIDNVCVTVDNVSATDKINNISLLVASDKEYNNIEQTVYADLNKLAAGNLIFKVGQPSANKYYKLVFDMQATGVNGVIQISKVQYNGSGDVILSPAQLSFNVPTCSAIIGREVEYPTLNNPNKLAVAYDSSDKSVATVTADGNVTLLSEGETIISASSAKTDKYEAGYAYYILTVKPATTADIANTPQTAYTVEKALQLIDAGKGLDTKVYVKGKITNIKEVSTQYGNATYTLSDEGKDNALFVYRGNYLGGAKFTNENQIKLNDVVVVYGNLVDYYGTKEFTTGSSIYSINGTSGINTVEVSDSNDATEYNIAGQRIRDAYKGVVIKGGKKFVKK
ncbi:MAG: leucine-rich repeat protein [Prevotella sp.]